MMPRVKLISGDEQDALTRWRKWLYWKPGERKVIKRKVNRRERQKAKRALAVSTE